MKPPRFYTPSHVELKHDFWIHDAILISRWHKLALQAGQEIVLFDGVEHDRLYKIVELNDNEAHLRLVTDYERRLPKRKIYLLWPVGVPGQNTELVQKCTELGVSHSMPLLTDNGEQADFDVGSARATAIDAVEKSDWSFVPTIREPMHVATALDELSGKVELYVCQQGNETVLKPTKNHIGILIPPANGWSEAEQDLLRTNNLTKLNIPKVTSYADIAVVAGSKLLQ